MKYLILTVLLILIVPGAQGQRIQQYLSLFSDSMPNYGMVVLHDSSGIQETAHVGFAAKSKPMNDSTVFCIGSITKMFTATLALKLQEKGDLDLDDTLGRYLEVPKELSRISLRRLLQHRSGITEIMVLPELVNQSLLDPDFNITDADIIQRIPIQAMANDSAYTYSNANYMLMRMVLEKVGKSDYLNLLKTHVLKPIGLENRVYPYSNAIPNLSHPILGPQDLNELDKSKLNDLSSGAGNLMMNAATLNSFVRSLFLHKTILSQSSLDQMKDYRDGGGEQVGLGVFLKKLNWNKYLTHSGRQLSYIAYVYLEKEGSESWVFLVNNANDNYCIDVINYVLFE